MSLSISQILSLVPSLKGPKATHHKQCFFFLKTLYVFEKGGVECKLACFPQDTKREETSIKSYVILLIL